MPGSPQANGADAAAEILRGSGPEEPVDPNVGRSLAGRYDLVELIAAGGMGRVYKAIQQPLGRVVAVKVLRMGGDPERLDDFSNRFTREAAVLGELQHPHTVRMFEYGVDGPLVFFAMEYVQGPTLADVVDDGPLEPLRAVNIVRQICSALDEAHEKGVVHRDLKPSNVLLAPLRGVDFVKVVDFGVVKITDAPPGDLTNPEIMVGTPTYMAPEQIDGEDDTDHRADIYALGVLLYVLFTGEKPFDVRGGRHMLRAHLTSMPVPFSKRGVDLPPIVEATVMQCLEKEPADRFATALQLARALNACEMALKVPALHDMTLRVRRGIVELPGPIAAGESGFDGLKSLPMNAKLGTALPRIALALSLASVLVVGSLSASVLWTRPVVAVAPPSSTEIGMHEGGELLEPVRLVEQKPAKKKAKSRSDLRDPFADRR